MLGSVMHVEASCGELSPGLARRGNQPLLWSAQLRLRGRGAGCIEARQGPAAPDGGIGQVC